MKKQIKRFALSTVVVLALFGAFTGVALAANYISWSGSGDYFQLIENLDLISQRGHEMKSDNENINRSATTLPNDLLKDIPSYFDNTPQRVNSPNLGTTRFTA